MSQKFISSQCPVCGGKGRVVSGRWLREQRQQAALTLREMARLMKLSAAYISDVELGRRRPTPKIVAAYEGLRHE